MNIILLYLIIEVYAKSYRNNLISVCIDLVSTWYGLDGPGIESRWV